MKDSVLCGKKKIPSSMPVSSHFLCTCRQMWVRLVLYIEETVKRAGRAIEHRNRPVKKLLPSLPVRSPEATRLLLFFSLDIGMITDEWLPEDMIEVLLAHGSHVNDSYDGMSFW